MSENIFLTESRRDVLRGTSEWTDDAVTVEKSRIRSKARTALAELIEVAQSEEIENRSVFEPAQVGLLLGLLIDDPAVMPPGGLSDSPGDLSVPERHIEYRNDVHSEATSTMLALKPPQRGTE
jgi:hypothetical protein